MAWSYCAAGRWPRYIEWRCRVKRRVTVPQKGGLLGTPKRWHSLPEHAASAVRIPSPRGGFRSEWVGVIVCVCACVCACVRLCMRVHKLESYSFTWSHSNTSRLVSVLAHDHLFSSTAWRRDQKQHSMNAALAVNDCGGSKESCGCRLTAFVASVKVCILVF